MRQAARQAESRTEMSKTDHPDVEAILATPDLADALDSEQFRRFLDHFPVAVAISELTGAEAPGEEHIVYTNLAFEALSGRASADFQRQRWTALRGEPADPAGGEPLSEAIVERTDHVGAYVLTPADGAPVVVAVHSNLIQDDDGRNAFRLVALVKNGLPDPAERDRYEERIREKEMLLWEIQHRVRNNLQMITALIRLEARTASVATLGDHFDRLAGRVQSLQLLYSSLEPDARSDEIDLGVYLSQIASAVMQSHATAGISLDLKVDTYPVSVNVAMPAGLVVNEVMTNALKYAFAGREGGTISLRSTTCGNGCQVEVADDGIGLPEGAHWPRAGSLSALIVRSLRDNAHASLAVHSAPGAGTRVVIGFTRVAALLGTGSAHGA